jgi:hypothetical protein
VPLPIADVVTSQRLLLAPDARGQPEQAAEHRPFACEFAEAVVDQVEGRKSVERRSGGRRHGWLRGGASGDTHIIAATAGQEYGRSRPISVRSGKRWQPELAAAN